MFQLFTSHHQAEELKDFFYTNGCYMWNDFARYRIPYGFTLFVGWKVYVNGKVIDMLKVKLK
jgi:hypothetical protein